MLKIILNRLKSHDEQIIAEEKAGSRAGRLELQPQNPVRKIPPASTKSVSCRHRFRESFDRVCSLMGHNEEAQYQFKASRTSEVRVRCPIRTALRGPAREEV